MDNCIEQDNLIEELNFLRKELEIKNRIIAELERSSETNQIFDTIANGIRIIDKDFNHLRVNKTFTELAKKSETEILKLKCYEAFEGPYCHTENCPIKRVLNCKGSVEAEVTKTLSDGRKIDCLLTAKPFYDAEGNIKGIIEDFRDVSSIKQSKIALMESEAKFKSYIDKCPDGIFIVDDSGKYLKANPAGCILVGYSEEELKQKSIKDISAKDVAHFSYLRDKGISFGEVSLLRKDQTEIIVELHAADIGNGHYIGFSRDISGRKKIEEALKESEIQHNLILQGISDLVILYAVESETDFRVLKINDSCLKILGLRKEQVVGKLIQEVLPEDLAMQLIKNDREAVRTLKPIFAKEVNYPFGCLEANFIPIVNEEGRCKHLVVTARDISTKKEIEKHALKIEKLESVGLLAGGIAHDFNNILTVITGNVSLAKLRLANCDGVSQVVELMNEVEKASLQARNLTQQLLTFAKGGAPILKTSSVSDLLKESVGFALSGSNVKCEFSIKEELWPVDIDEGQISQVINNLVINADHAMPEGGLIKVIVENASITGKEPVPLNEGNYVKISIIDQGIGIPKEYLNKVFDPYFTTKQKGNGLGLTTAYSIVRKHNGCLLVNSTLGKGSVFHIYLPASQNTVHISEEPKPQTLGSIGTGRVLVMDDDKMIRMILRDALTHLGFEVRCVKDGQQACKEYKYNQERGKPFDLVIMDLTIPGAMGGKETIKELLKLDPSAKA